LTRAVLDAACKYPWTRDDARAAAGKFGVYDDDLPVFEWLRQGADDCRRSLEAQVMDWSDDVAYSVHDLEDALYAGQIRLDFAADQAERQALVEQCYHRVPDAAPHEIDCALDRLVALPYWPASYDGTQQGLAMLKNAASELIGRFCEGAERATRERHGEQALTRYAADLVVPREVRLECEVLKAVAARYVMGSAAATERYGNQRRLIRELVEALRAAAPQHLDRPLQEAFDAATDEPGRLRAVVDQVASLTDTSAAVLHRRLAG